MDLLTEEFYEEMHILDPNGQEVAYHNQIPDYAPAEKQALNLQHECEKMGCAVNVEKP